MNRYGLDIVCIRILSCFVTPQHPRMLATWLSPDDCARLFEACLTAPSPGFQVIYGVSANTRGGWVSLAGARALGYEPHDDAEDYAAELIATYGEPDPDDRDLQVPRRRLHLPRPRRPPAVARRGPRDRPESSAPSGSFGAGCGGLALAGDAGVLGDDARGAAPAGGSAAANWSR